MDQCFIVLAKSCIGSFHSKACIESQLIIYIIYIYAVHHMPVRRRRRAWTERPGRSTPSKARAAARANFITGFSRLWTPSCGGHGTGDGRACMSLLRAESGPSRNMSHSQWHPCNRASRGYTAIRFICYIGEGSTLPAPRCKGWRPRLEPT